MHTPALSIIIPCYNEEQNIRPLFGRLKDALTAVGISDFVVIFVENGCTDNSAECLETLHQEDNRVWMIQLSRNFGFQGAISAGMEYANGSRVAMMDGDLQDPPEEIPHMVALLNEGYDVVYAVRTERKESLLKRMFYSLFYILWQRSAVIHVPRDAGDFCVMTQRVAEVIRSFPERIRFIRGFRAWAGFKQIGYPYKRDARAAGHTKFGIGPLLQLAFDGILSFSLMPLKLITLMAAFIASGAFIMVCYQLAQVGVNFWHTGSLTLASTHMIDSFIILLSATMMVSLGIIGEYVGRIYEEVKDRPTYIVKRTLTSGKQPFDLLEAHKTPDQVEVSSFLKWI
jgi:polyisoprenyl-phosphate glycosyltransferase